MNDGHTDLEVKPLTRTLFKPGSWLAKIDFINHLILFNNVLITVLSEKDGGKTSFTTLLVDHLDPQIKAISRISKAPNDREELIHEVATQLHLNQDGETNIASLVKQINERKAHVLLIIDEAEKMAEPLIKEMLLAIKSQEEFGFFHLCLVSDYSLIATLNDLAAEQYNNIIHTIELGPLNENETRTYVLQRAMTAHLINKPLSDAHLKQFYQLTKGNLAKINNQLEPFIQKCFKQKEHNKMFLFHRAAAAAGAISLAVCSYFYFFNSNIPQQPLPIIEPVVAVAQPLASTIASWQDSAIIQLVHAELPKKQILDELDADTSDTVNAMPLVDKVVVIPTVKNMHPEHAPRLGANEPLLESRLVKIVLKSKTPAVKKVITQSLKGAKAIYTIQLVASHKITDVNRFKKSSKIYAQTKVRHFKNTKGDWYILTFGEYRSRGEAQSQAKKLPQNLARLNPWVRPMAGLKTVG